MHPLMVEAIIARCRQRQREGDCPTVPPFSPEQLEDCIVQMAADAAPCRPPTKILMTDEWLRRRIVTDPDVDIEAGAYPAPAPEPFVPCAQCRKPVERVRHCYVTPTCYACLPPPPPIEAIEHAAPAPELPRKVEHCDCDPCRQYNARLVADAPKEASK